MNTPKNELENRLASQLLSKISASTTSNIQRIGNDEKARSSFCEIFAIVQNTYNAVIVCVSDQLLQFFKDIANGLFANLQYVIGGEKLTFRDKESYVVDWIANSVPLNSHKNHPYNKNIHVINNEDANDWSDDIGTEDEGNNVNEDEENKNNSNLYEESVSDDSEAGLTEAIKETISAFY